MNPIQPDCSICLNPVLPPVQKIDTLCGHTFHKVCLNGWLKLGNFSCPNCRQNVLGKTAVDLAYETNNLAIKIVDECHRIDRRLEFHKSTDFKYIDMMDNRAILELSEKSLKLSEQCLEMANRYELMSELIELSQDFDEDSYLNRSKDFKHDALVWKERGEVLKKALIKQKKEYIDNPWKKLLLNHYTIMLVVFLFFLSIFRKNFFHIKSNPIKTNL